MVRIIRGPVGSGKTTGCCYEIAKRASEQEASPSDGYKRFKAAIVRNTNPELQRTTLETWLATFPERRCGLMKRSPPMRHRITRPPSGWIPGIPEKDNPGTPGLDLIVDFFALDRPDQAASLLSYEGTVMWFNEVREIELAIIERATERVGRYPSMEKGGVMPTWFGIIGDTNPPDDDHWLYEKEFESCPPTWAFFNQPPGVLEVEQSPRNPEVYLSKNKYFPHATVKGDDFVAKGGGATWMVNPEAENVLNLPVVPNEEGFGQYEQRSKLSKYSYYLNLVTDKTRQHIDIYYGAEYGGTQEGKPVVPQFNRHMHVSANIPILKGVPVKGGFDIGGGTLNPAGIIFQRFRGRYLVHAEVTGDGVGLTPFVNAFKSTLASLFQNQEPVMGNFWGDPAGQQKEPLLEFTMFEHLLRNGIRATPTYTNNLPVRIEAIRSPFQRLVDQQPAILIHPRCKRLIKGLQGKWYYKRLQISGEARYADSPVKNMYSHPCDALGYGLLGEGEGKPIDMERDYGEHQDEVYAAQTDFNPYEV